MQTYLVGGAVRDELLGLPVAERDWVVVGATPAEMERLGFRPVGRDFPVYLHPQTHEEYALARSERKVGPGYRGFVTQFSPQVTLEQDLQRRDLTINAMARDADGRIIDPFGGRDDLAQRRLRHVSAAFVEDPVRILRVARFAARLAGLGFRLTADTAELMRRMVEAGEVHALVPERVWREIERALGEPHPEACFETLQGCGALAVLLPELAWSDPARRALLAAVALGADASVRWAALLARIDARSLESLADRLRIPNDYRELALLNARLASRIRTAPSLDAGALLQLLDSADAFRRPERFGQLLLAAEAAAGAEAPAGTTAVPQAGAARELLTAAHAAAASVTLSAAQRAGLEGAAIGRAVREARESRLEELLREWRG